MAVVSLTFAYFAGLFLLLMFASVYEISLRFVLYQQNPQSARRNNFPGGQIYRWFLLLSENLSASNYPGTAYRGLRTLRETCMWPDKTPLVLKDGETIVAVGKTVQRIAFYIKNNHEDHAQENKQ